MLFVAGNIGEHGLENSLTGIRAKTATLAVLPIAWLAERKELPVEYCSESVEGQPYREVLTTSVWMYLLYSYLLLVRTHFGDKTADAVWTNQQAMLEAEVTGAASAIGSAFALIDTALQTAADVTSSPEDAIDIPGELGVALALLLGLPGSPGYRVKGNDETMDVMPAGIEWFLSTQLQRGREQIHREFEPVFRASPHFSPRGEMIAQRFGFTADFLKKRNTDCIPD